MDLFKKHPFITGTLFLTLIGLTNRVIGFFFRLYLTSLFGEEGMGIFQLITPILTLSFALFGAGYQVALSKLCAIYKIKKNKKECIPLFCGLSVSLPLSCIFSLALFHFADPCAVLILHEPQTGPMIKICAFSIPLSGLHACINGYLYGVKKSNIAALSDLVEQLSRVGSVFLFHLYALNRHYTLSISTSVLGVGIGELSAVVFCLLLFLFSQNRDLESTPFFPNGKDYAELFKITLPYTANRLSISLLLGLETTSVPIWLQAFGYDHKSALSLLGVLTGMVLPLLFFPNVLTGSISTLLLPQISEKQSVNHFASIKKLTSKAIGYSVVLGLLFQVFFFLTGSLLGNLLFHSPRAGRFLSALSFLCPFLYLDTALSGILHGLGYSGKLLICNLACLALRLSLLAIFIPRFGTGAYVASIILCGALQCLLSIFLLQSFFKKHP